MNRHQLRKLRESSGLTQEEAAAAMNVSQVWLSFLEGGQKRITLRTANKFRRAIEQYTQYREHLTSVVMQHADLDVPEQEIRRVALESIRVLNERVSLRTLLEIPDVHKYIHSRLQAVVGGVASERSLIGSQERLEIFSSAT